MPHLGHVGMIAFVIPGGFAANVDMWSCNKKKITTCLLIQLIVNSLLQAFTPSVQVCSNFELSAPHFLNQAPPPMQQLTFPEFLFVPHLGHMGVIAFVTTGVFAANMGMRA